MIGHREVESVNFPKGFVDAVQHSYIELNKLMLDPHGYRTYLEKVVNGLNEIVDNPTYHGEITFPLFVSPLKLMDDIYKQWKNAEQASCVGEAIMRVTEISRYLEFAVHLVLDKKEYEDRMHLCIDISKTITPYSHGTINY